MGRSPTASAPLNQTREVKKGYAMNKENCARCKWLDQVRHYAPGEGYCCMVERSKDYKPGDKARYSNMLRCELYKSGSFADRYKTEEKQ